MCVEGYCFQPCGSEADCPEDLFCIDHFCSNGGGGGMISHRVIIVSRSPTTNNEVTLLRAPTTVTTSTPSPSAGTKSITVFLTRNFADKGKDYYSDHWGYEVH